MRVFRWLGRFTMVAGPVLVLLVFVLAAFLMWVLVTPTGSRWALTTAIEALDGKVESIEGSVWNGLQVGDVSLKFPGAAVRLEALELRADWSRLLDRQLHVFELKTDTAWVDLSTIADETPDDTSEEAFAMPELPVSIRLDDIAVGEVIVTRDGRPLPMTITDVGAALALGPEHGQLWLRDVNIATDSIEASAEGEVSVQALHHPWPMSVDLDVRANGLRPEAPLCLRSLLPTLPAQKNGEVPAENGNLPITSWLAGVGPESCPIELHARAQGSLDNLSLTLQGNGQGMTLEADAELAPTAAMPLQSANLDLVLPDGSSLSGEVGWEAIENATAEAGRTAQRLIGKLSAERLDVGHLAGGITPAAVLSFDSRFRVGMDAAQVLRDVELDLSIHEGSQWNEEPLTGDVGVSVQLPASEPQAPSNVAAADSLLPAGLNTLIVQRFDTALTLGKNRIETEGAFGSADSVLQLMVQAPRLSDFWPDLPGGIEAKGNVAGSLREHALDLQGQYTPANATQDELGSAPIALNVRAEGAWGGDPEGWRGQLAALEVDHAHLGVDLGAPLEIHYIHTAVAPAWQLTAGATEIALSVNGRPVVSFRHDGSQYSAGRWETAGSLERFLISPQVLRQIGTDFDITALQDDARGGVKVRGAREADDWELAFGADWNLRFDGVLLGDVQLRRLSGDVMVPGPTPFPLGLQDLTLDLTLARASDTASRLAADLHLESTRMGRIEATATTLVHATSAGGIYLNPSDTKVVTLDAAIADLGWTNIFLGDAIDLGGAVQAQLKLTSQSDGSWSSDGTISGESLRFVMIDQGVRLLDGTLRARLEDESLVLERLAFPARLRAEPKEWRTAEWVSTNPDAQGGSLVVTGDWNLFESRGVIDVELYRFPIVQRADRYAMMTGQLQVDAALPDLDITGKLTADAGWFDLDMLGGIPTVDSDVVVIRPGEEEEIPVPLGITLDLEVDLGPRFYLTGYGLNSGLVGNMRITMRQGKLTGMGALRTRGGAIEAYGQRLQLRRGAITFQGDITRPVLDIEALRTGLAVEAGVRVAGTARNPRIELVSYPDVSEIEKLSWLLLGHGPNDSGGDMALLFSVGTSFLGDGEPFYRRFGIDEVSMRSGELGSVASVLPAESVVSDLDTGTSDIERRFINVSKRLTNGVTLSIRQALSDTGTVARASYRLARGLTAEASVGTVNGLALVYRWFSRERRGQSDE